MAIMAYSKYDYNIPYVEFDGKHCYRQYGLILAKAEVNAPKLIKTVINTPTGQIDITDDVRKTRFYDNRNISLQFIVLDKESFNKIEDDIMANLADNIMPIYISDKDRIYNGRISVDRFYTNRKKGTLAITVDAEPYSYRNVVDMGLDVAFAGQTNTDIVVPVTTTGYTVNTKEDELLFFTQYSSVKASTNFSEITDAKTLSTSKETSFGKMTTKSGRTVTFSTTSTSTASGTRRIRMVIRRRLLG